VSRSPARRRRASARSLGWLAAAAVGAFGPLARAQAPQLIANYRDTDIRVVAEQVAQVMNKTIIVDPRVRAQVTVLSNGPLSRDAFYQLFLSTLEVHGYQALNSGGALEIVPDANARFGQGDDYVTEAVFIQHIAAAQLVPILRPLLPQSAHLAAHPASNALIIADRPENLTRIVNLIKRMDQVGNQEVEVIPLQNASADEVVRMLSSLSQAAQAAGGSPPIQVIADTRTNSILLSGNEATRLQYRALIAHLDTPSAQGGNTLVRYLNYADAEDLASKLQSQFGSSGGTTRAAPAGGAAGAGGAAETGPVTIWADKGTNALVINAPERIRKDMMSVINQIDIPRLQVLVDAIIVEITEKKAAELGLTWAIDGSAHNGGVGLTNFGSTTPGIIQLATAGASGTPNPASLGDGVKAAIGSVSDTGTSWAALLSALQGDAQTNIVSTPHIVTLDNQEAEIKVGQEVPFVTGQYTNANTQAAGTVNPFQTIQREQVGTSLKITPHINEGNGVKLDIEQETSSISAGASGAVDLVTNRRTITTSVFVKDSDVLILGGLIDDQMLENEQRVPGLGRIPGLGWLFRARKTTHDKTNLMVFIRPTILHDRQDARFQTAAKYNYIREQQRLQTKGGAQLMHREQQPTLQELPPLSPDQESAPRGDAAPNGDAKGPPPKASAPAGAETPTETPSAGQDDGSQPK
jgi:general secretion pathway protein D